MARAAYIVLRRRLATGWAVFAIAAIASVAAGAGRDSAPARNVLLVSMDTTRADYLGCYGHPTIATPNIDALAREGVLFERCDVSAPLTLPSHATMLTSLYPFVHGARDNGAYRLAPENITLVEQLRQAGYATMASVGAFVLNREYGLDQGFEVYDDVRGPRPEEPRAERSAEEVAAAALEWLTAHAKRPFFLFVHFFDPHQPYAAPQRFAQRYPRGGYLAEIAYVDEQIGRLLTALRDLGVESETLVVLTADHGESLGAHQEATHGAFLYQTTVRVPLILRCPALLPAGQRVRGMARSIDIAPTALALLDQPPLPLAQGASLLPMIRGESSALGYSYAETLYPTFNFGFSSLRSLSDGRWKFIHAPRPELYDLAADPDERVDLATAHPERVEELREALRDLIAESPRVARPDLAPHAPSSTELENLQALGYLGGSATLTGDELSRFEPRGPNPADHARLMGLAIQGANLLAMGQPQRAEQLLRGLVDESPQIAGKLAWIHQSLGGALAAQGKYAAAADAFRSAVSANPQDGESFLKLGRCLIYLDQMDAACQALQTAERLLPAPASARRFLALASVAKGDIQGGVSLWRTCRPGPRGEPSMTAPAALADSALLGEIAQAASAQQLFTIERSVWKGALLSAPADEQALSGLAWLLATCPDDRIRAGVEALRVARLAVAAAPGSTRARAALSAALAEVGDFEAAQVEIDHIFAAADAALAGFDRSTLGQLRDAITARRPYRAPPP